MRGMLQIEKSYNLLRGQSDLGAARPLKPCPAAALLMAKHKAPGLSEPSVSEGQVLGRGAKASHARIPAKHLACREIRHQGHQGCWVMLDGAGAAGNGDEKSTLSSSPL